VARGGSPPTSTLSASTTGGVDVPTPEGGELLPRLANAPGGVRERGGVAAVAGEGGGVVRVA